MSLAIGPLLVIPFSLFLSQGISILVGFGIPFILGNFVFAWLSLGTPIIKRLITRRLLVRGLSAQQLKTGLPVGISDPGKSSMRKFGMFEEDLGMLWIGADELVYYGDHTDWTISHADRPSYPQSRSVRHRAARGCGLPRGSIRARVLP